MPPLYSTQVVDGVHIEHACVLPHSRARLCGQSMECRSAVLVASTLWSTPRLMLCCPSPHLCAHEAHTGDVRHPYPSPPGPATTTIGAGSGFAYTRNQSTPVLSLFNLPAAGCARDLDVFEALLLHVVQWIQLRYTGKRDTPQCFSANLPPEQAAAADPSMAD